MNKNKHLTLDDRYQIQQGLEQRLSFREIAKRINKDNTTIAKEIKGHLIFEKKGAPYRPFNDCRHRTYCPHIRDLCGSCSQKRGQRYSFCANCSSKCRDYLREECSLWNKPPYVCNGCSMRSTCTLEKHTYHVEKAQKEYEAIRSESRSGFNITEEERKRLDSQISPLLKQGQSLHHILISHADSIPCCERTAYTYADNGLF